MERLGKVDMIFSNKNTNDRPIRKLTKEEFFRKVDEGLSEVESGEYRISESAEAELAAAFGLMVDQKTT